MIGPLKKIDYFFDRILIHARNAGQGKDAFTFLTATAAMLYVISSTLGSGSYKETDLLIISFIMNNVAGIILYFLLLILIILFSFCLLSYLSETLEFFKNHKGNRYLFRFFPDGTASKVIYTSALITLLLFVHALFREKSGYKTNIDVKAIIFFLLFMTMVFAIYGIERFIANFDLGFALWYFVIILTSMTVCFTIYRDSYKSSTNENNRYCYWISYETIDVPEEAKKFRDSIDYKICKDLSLKRINFKSSRDSLMAIDK